MSSIEMKLFNYHKIKLPRCCFNCKWGSEFHKRCFHEEVTKVEYRKKKAILIDANGKCDNWVKG